MDDLENPFGNDGLGMDDDEDEENHVVIPGGNNNDDDDWNPPSKVSVFLFEIGKIVIDKILTSATSLASP